MKNEFVISYVEPEEEVEWKYNIICKWIKTLKNNIFSQYFGEGAFDVFLGVSTHLKKYKG